MKKLIVVISFTLFIFSTLIFTFHFSFQKHAYDILIGNHQQVHILLNDDASQHDFIKTLKQFSEKHHVNISQYTFLNDDVEHIYSTNLSNDPELKVYS